ncbi:MAG: sigma 54-interacting transcriptional regulator [Sandaracinaceae bacterium]
MGQDNRTIQEGTLAASRAIGDAKTSLVVHWGDGSEVFALEDGVPRVLGRAAPADIVIPEEKLSRSHARFTSTEEGVRVDDLGSTNGTHHKGERIESVVLAPGDSVTLGRVTVTVSEAAGRAGLLGDFLGYRELRQRIRDEIVRTRTFRRGVTVMFVRAIAGDPDVSTWARGMQAQLREVDRAALYGSAAAVVLLPETDEARARVIAEKIAAYEERLGVGVALHGSTEAELIDAARRCARIATKSIPVLVHAHDGLVAADEPIFASPAMIELAELLDRVARSRVPVFVTGETGVGKEVVAQAIHRRGARADGPLLTLHCDATPDDQVEALLFAEDEGLVARARGGTLFLDEIGELPTGAQTLLLNTIDAGEADVRIVAATTQAPSGLVESGALKKELLFRLDAIRIAVPPLRERDGDLDPLIDRFLAEASADEGARISGIQDEARAALHGYGWPGNVRELRNVIESAVVACTTERIRITDLPAHVRPAGPSEDEPERIDLRAALRDYEQRLLARAIEKAEGDGSRAAALLSIPLRTLERKLVEHGLELAGD